MRMGRRQEGGNDATTFCGDSSDVESLLLRFDSFTPDSLHSYEDRHTFE